KAKDNWDSLVFGELHFDPDSGGRKTCFGNNDVSSFDHISVPKIAEPRSILWRFGCKWGVTVDERIHHFVSCTLKRLRHSVNKRDVLIKCCTTWDMCKGACNVYLHYEAGRTFGTRN